MKELVVLCFMIILVCGSILNRSYIKIREAEKVDSLVQQRFHDHDSLLDTVRTQMRKLERLSHTLK